MQEYEKGPHQLSLKFLNCSPSSALHLCSSAIEKRVDF